MAGGHRALDGCPAAVFTGALRYLRVRRPLEIDKMVECRLGERHQPDHETRRMIARRYRQVRAVKVRGAAEYQQQVVDECQMGHFLTATPSTVLRHRATASDSVGDSPSSAPRFRLNAA